MNQSRRSWLTHSLSAAGLLAVGTDALAQSKSTQYVQAARLVSIGGALTEIIYLFNCNMELVGVDTTSIYPEAATRLPNVGYARTLSSEGILALKPSQVIATEDAGPPTVLKQIGDAGIAVAILKSNYQFAGVIERVQKIGSLVHKLDAAMNLVKQLNLEWKKTQQQVAYSGLNKMKALFILSQNPTQIMVSGGNTSADAVIAYAGAKNALSGFNGFKPLTPEAIIGANPDVILMTDQGIKAVGGISGVLRFPGIDKTNAGKKKKIVSLETMYMLGFGPRMPLAVAELNTLLQQAAS